MEEKIEKIKEILNEIENMNNKVNLYDEIYNIISCYSQEYQEELKMQDLDDEDIYNIISNVLCNQTITYEIQQEIEEYCNFKNRG